MAREYIDPDEKKRIKKLFVPYPDIVPTHPNLSDEELDEMIKKEIEESKKIKEWPLI